MLLLPCFMEIQNHLSLLLMDVSIVPKSIPSPGSQQQHPILIPLCVSCYPKQTHEVELFIPTVLWSLKRRASSIVGGSLEELEFRFSWVLIQRYRVLSLSDLLCSTYMKEVSVITCLLNKINNTWIIGLLNLLICVCRICRHNCAFLLNSWLLIRQSKNFKELKFWKNSSPYICAHNMGHTQEKNPIQCFW